MRIFLFTIMNSGTRTIKKWYEDQGHDVEYTHPVPTSWLLYQRKRPDLRVTTVRNPRDIALSWAKGPRPRYKNCSWKQQWQIWQEAIEKYGPYKIHVLEEMDLPAEGQDLNEILFPLPSDFEAKIQFALDIMNKLNIEHPYGDNP